MLRSEATLENNSEYNSIRFDQIISHYNNLVDIDKIHINGIYFTPINPISKIHNIIKIT